MSLVEDCTLRFDDPVDDLLPELADLTVLADPHGPLDDTVAAKRPITLRDLLTFTLGTGMVPVEPGTVPIADALNALGEPPPDEWRTPHSAWAARASAGWRQRTSATMPPP